MAEGDLHIQIDHDAGQALAWREGGDGLAMKAFGGSDKCGCECCCCVNEQEPYCDDYPDISATFTGVTYTVDDDGQILMNGETEDPPDARRERRG